MEEIYILGTKVAIEPRQRVFDHMCQTLRASDKVATVYTPNPEILLYAFHHPDYQKILNSSDINLPDGKGVQVAADYIDVEVIKVPLLREVLLWLHLKLLIFLPVFGLRKYNKIPERITGIDILNQLIPQAEINGWRIYLLGGKEHVAEKAKQNLINRFPNLQIVGAEDGGKVDWKGEGEQDEEVINRINESQAEIVVVCFGHPKQEYWINNYKNKLINAKIIIGAGGVLDYWSGEKNRAPIFIQNLSLEWLWRLLIEPSRVQRVINAVIVFPYLLFLQKIKSLI